MKGTNLHEYNMYKNADLGPEMMSQVVNLKALGLLRSSSARPLLTAHNEA